MNPIRYIKTDFPTGFDPELLRRDLITSQGKSFNLATAADFVQLFLDDGDNEAAVRTVCLAHFAKTPQQRSDDFLTYLTTDFFSNGDKQKRFLLELFYEVDQRLRVLESRAAITKQQFFNGVQNIYKNI